ncbi:hypothetical protein TUM12370_36390 [Salmonella enterica subsp. enterica serovar Choleraesuis]|nr:hypothetical protein TUM12370_36390 [Salmonella enterica subsp. enterica serovar Choleraesuis]
MKIYLGMYASGFTPSTEPVSAMIIGKKSLMSQVLERERTKRASNDALFLRIASNVLEINPEL